MANTQLAFVALSTLLVLILTLWVAILAHERRQLGTPARRKLRVLDEHTCRTCTAWNREEGQAIMTKFPAFRAAAEVVTPAEMAYGYEINEAGERVGLKGPAGATTMRWEDFGACHVHGELRHITDTCTNYAGQP